MDRHEIAYKDSIRNFTGESESEIESCAFWAVKCGILYPLSIIDGFAKKHQRLPIDLNELKVFAQEVIMQLPNS